LLCGEQDITEAIAQLAMYPRGRKALLQDPTVTEALQQVAAEGWEQEARKHAQAALAALADRQPDVCVRIAQTHVMMSYQWDVQEVVKRIVNELQVRGYRTWFGAHTVRLACSLRSCCRSFAQALILAYVSVQTWTT
jgi:hypothetical protein